MFSTLFSSISSLVSSFAILSRSSIISCVLMFAPTVLCFSVACEKKVVLGGKDCFVIVGVVGVVVLVLLAVLVVVLWL